MIRAVNYALLSILFALMAAAYKVTYETGRTETRIAALRADLAHERERMQVLQADWEYLNSPRFLEGWARRLGLRPMDPVQVISLSDLPFSGGTVRVASAGTVAHRAGYAAAVGGPGAAEASAVLDTPAALPRPKPSFRSQGGAP